MKQLSTMNDFLTLLNERGLRPTGARLQLLSMLEKTGTERMTAEQIFMSLAGTGATLSLASVYRVLKELSDFGIVERGWCQDGQEVRLLFSLRGDPNASKTELLCVSCHRSMPVALPELRAELNRLAKPLQLQPQERPIVIHVTCPECASTERNKRGA